MYERIFLHLRPGMIFLQKAPDKKQSFTKKWILIIILQTHKALNFFNVAACATIQEFMSIFWHKWPQLHFARFIFSHSVLFAVSFVCFMFFKNCTGCTGMPWSTWQGMLKNNTSFVETRMENEFDWRSGTAGLDPDLDSTDWASEARNHTEDEEILWAMKREASYILSCSHIWHYCWL